MRGVEPAYTQHVRRLYGGPSDRDGFDLERLFGAGEAVQSLTLHPGWSVLMDLLSAERAELQGKLEGPKPLEHAETSHLLGQVRGLKAAEAAATAVVEHYRLELTRQQAKHEAATEFVAGG